MLHPIAPAVGAVISLGIERRWRRVLCEEWRPHCRSWEDLHNKYNASFQAAAVAPNCDQDAAAVLRDFAQTLKSIKADPVVMRGTWNASPSDSTAEKSASGAIILIGTCHYSTEAAAKCCQVVQMVRPSGIVLELCTERMLPILACPAEHRAAWLTAKIPYSLGPGLWEGFGIDQECCLAYQDGLDIVQTLDTLVKSVQPPFLVALADAPQSERETDDPARDKLLAKACVACVCLGHKITVAVVGADHVHDVAREIAMLGHVVDEPFCINELQKPPFVPDSFSDHKQIALDNLDVELADGEISRACFLSPTAVVSLHRLRSEVIELISPEDIAIWRSGVVDANARERSYASISTLQDFEKQVEFRGTSRFLKTCLENGSMIQPSSFSGLTDWWSSQISTCS